VQGSEFGFGEQQSYREAPLLALPKACDDLDEASTAFGRGHPALRYQLPPRPTGTDASSPPSHSNNRSTATMPSALKSTRPLRGGNNSSSDDNERKVKKRAWFPGTSSSSPIKPALTRTPPKWASTSSLLSPSTVGPTTPSRHRKSMPVLEFSFPNSRLSIGGTGATKLGTVRE
jgi:hypothetical protein